MVCKHLVKESADTNPSFFPQYVTTRRRHDYPLIWFGGASTNIDPANNPWTENSLDEDTPMNEDDSNIELNFQARNELIESRKAELVEDEKMFKSLLEVV